MPKLLHPKGKPTTVEIPMRDGTTLAATLWLPRSDFRGPAILVQTPYNRLIWKPQVEGDFAWVVLDWRGFYGSKPAKTGSADYGRDGYDAVEWIATQPWCDGKVGTWGQSALGRVQYWTAAYSPPHLVCMVPIVASISNFHGNYYVGGVLRKEYVELLERLGFGAMARPIREHPERDDYWQAVENRPDASTIRVPVLQIGGWFDLYPAGMLETLRRLPNVHLIMGPWDHHAAASREFSRTEARRFLEHHLRAPNDWDRTSRVRAFQMGEERWLDGWPGDTEVRRIEMGGGSYDHDPAQPVPTIGGANLDPALSPGTRDQARLPGLRLETPPLTEDLRLSGFAKLEYSASVDAHLHARLCDVHPDGRWMLIVDSAGRGPLEFPPTANTFLRGHRVGLILTGSNHPRYELWPTAHRQTISGAALELPLRR